MGKIISLIIYMVLVPMSLGIIPSFLIKKTDKENSYDAFEFVLRIYMRGMLLEYVIFELLYRVYLKNRVSYDDLMSALISIWRPVSVVLMIVAGMMVLYEIKKDGWNHRIVHMNQKRVVRYLFMLLYMLIAVLFVLPNQADNTVNHLIDVTCYGVISDHYEVFYLMLINLIGVGIVPGVHYILDLFLLIFFFAVYDSIERILQRYDESFRENAVVCELTFAILLVLLFFIRGSIYTSIPQNIWNAKTLLASCLYPLVFIWGYEFIMAKRVISVIKMLSMLLVTSMFYGIAWKFTLIPIVVAIGIVLTEYFGNRKRVEG